MENCYTGISVNSVLLLKERIIKVETLLEKHASLARRFNDLEKSNSQIAENERTAKKDAAKYLEKYCKLTKKCATLLNKIKNLEEIVKDKTNVVAEQQNELTKLDSVLKIYKLERKNYQVLKKDKDFLLSLAWKLFKDSGLEAKENKYRKNADIFFKRFEKDLETLKLGDFRNRKPRNTSKSRAEEFETASLTAELPVLNRVESDFIDIDIGSESVKSISFQEVDNCDVRVQECKPCEVVTIKRDENDVPLVAETDSNNQSQAAAIGHLFHSSHSEKHGAIRANESCFGVHNSVDNTANYGISASNGDGCTADSIYAPILPKKFNEVNVIEVFQAQENEVCGDFNSTDYVFSNSEDKMKVEDSGTDHKSPSECNELSKNRYFSCKQYKRKSLGNHDLDIDRSFIGIQETAPVNINFLEYANKSMGQCDRNNGLKTISFNSYGEDGADTIERKINKAEEPSLLFLGENDIENCKTDKGRLEHGNSETRELCQYSSGVPDDIKRKPQINVSSAESGENCFLFNMDNKQEKVSNKDFGPESCEINQRQCVNPTRISDDEIKAVTSDVKNDLSTGVHGTILHKSSVESIKEISDEEIFDILKNVKTVRLISPLKEMERKEVSESGRLIKSIGKPGRKKCLLNNKLFGDVKTKTKVDAEKVQILNNPSLRDRFESDEKSTMVDESTQTCGLETMENKETNWKNPKQNEKPDKPAAVSGTKSLVQKIFKKIWNGKLKKKLKNLEELTKMSKTHPCCFMLLKTLLEYFCVHNLNNAKCEKEVVYNLLRNGFIRSRYKSKIRAVKKKSSSWHVEDAPLTDTGSNKSQYFFGCTGRMNHFVTEAPVYNNESKRLNILHIPPESDGLVETRYFDWLSTKKSGSVAQRDVLENPFRSCLPDSIIHDITIGDLKKENENFRSLIVDNDDNCSRSFFGGDCNMVDKKNIQDIPKPIIEFDKVMSAGIGSAEKSECHDRSVDSCGFEGEPIDVQKCDKVPRRSSRIQGRNDRLKVTDTSSKCVSDFENSPAWQNDESDSISVVSGNNISSPASPIGCIQSENFKSVGADLELPKISESLQNKYELLFDETDSVQPTENISDNCKENQPAKITSPKVSYNLRHKTVKSAIGDNENPLVGRKRTACRPIIPKLTKRTAKALESDCYYPSEEENTESNTEVEQLKPQEGPNLLDSIMTAMTKQTEEFKPKRLFNIPVNTDIGGCNGVASGSVLTPQHCSFPSPGQQGFCLTPRSHKNSDVGSMSTNFTSSWKLGKQSPEESCKQCVDVKNFPLKKRHAGNKVKKLVETEISKFLKVEIKSAEDGEEKLKPCIAVLEKASEDVIASVIVAEVMANVDEELQDFDRPAPPLTQTQHRLMTILTILTNSCEQMSKINYKILNTIWKKLFPEKFFWPDDSVEMASRFYSALCKKINYFKGIWKFCFKAVSSMRQRWCIPIFVVFQVWPDILHNATEIQDNILVNTFVNVILHAPKSEGLRRKRQEGKLLAIKHLLINFYNFQVNVTIEQLTQQLFKSLLNDTPGSAEALIFVSKCRHWTWVKKNIIPPLIKTLTNWSNGTVIDECGFKTLDIIQQISSVLPVEDNATPPSTQDIVSALSHLLGSSFTNPNKEQNIIRTLCSLGHHTGVKEILCGLSNKFPSHDSLHAEIKKAISSSCRKRKQLIMSSKNMTKLESKMKKKKQEMRKKKKKVKKKMKFGTNEKTTLAVPTD